MVTRSYDTPATEYLLAVQFIGVFDRNDMFRIVQSLRISFRVSSAAVILAARDSSAPAETSRFTAISSPNDILDVVTGDLA